MKGKGRRWRRRRRQVDFAHTPHSQVAKARGKEERREAPPPPLPFSPTCVRERVRGEREGEEEEIWRREGERERGSSSVINLAG